MRNPSDRKMKKQMRQYGSTPNMFSEFTATRASLIIAIIICGVEVLNLVFNQWIFNTAALYSKGGEPQFLRVITAQWVNGGLVNLIGMLCILVFFAPLLEKRLGWFHFGFMVTLGGLFASFAALVYAFFTDETFLYFGSMGMGLAVFSGIFFMFADRQVRIVFFPQPLRLKYVVLVFAIIWLVMEYSESKNSGDSRYLFQLVAIPFSYLYLTFIFPSEARGKKKKRQSGKHEKYQRKIKPRTKIDLARENDSEVDKILDKISENGFQSLSSKERKILDKASKSNDR